ncbi:MAG: valine--tRNA ligase [Phycisphaerales bacterium]
MTTTEKTQHAGAAEPLAKAYRPEEAEPRVRARWAQSKAFHADPEAVTAGGKRPYSIVIPPPNVTGALHLGHALNNTLQDILIRSRRMQGFEALWMPGADHAGIATQTVVEKRILAPQGRKRTDYARDEFIALVQEWKDEYEERIKGQLLAMGCSCDFDRWRFTMDEVCAAAVREAFFRLFKAGLIYRGKRLVNWDPVTQTALADDEVEMEEVEGNFYYLRYPLVHEAAPGNHDPVTWGELATRNYPGAERHPEDQQAWITVATTRPETYLGDTAVAVNPRDPRAKPLKGFKCELPLVGRIIPILEDDYVVLPDPNSSDNKAKFATGFLKVTPAHDPNDWELGRRHDLPVINVMAPDASISDQHGWEDVGDAHLFVGKSREDARKLVVEEFRARSVAEGGESLLEDIKSHVHSVGHSYRSHAAIEPYLSDQWYVRVSDDRLVGAAQRALPKRDRSTSTYPPNPKTPGDGELRIVPDRYAKMYEAWHDNLRDWCISRQLWWGHRIPVWSSVERAIDRLDPDTFAAFAEQLMGYARDGRLAIQHRGEIVPLASFEREDESLAAGFFCVCDPEGRDAEVVAFLERHGYERDPDVLDTWFSSALWPLSTMGWPEPAGDTGGLLEAFNPTSVLSTAREILTLWVSRMVMFNRFFTEDDADPARRGRLPFGDVYIHAVVQDGEGKRMSKSAGNGVDPLDIIETHGADAMRYTLCQMTTQTQDVRMPVERDEATGRNTSPKFDLGKRFCNKLWNASRFTMMMLAESEAGAADRGLAMIDRWMLSRLADATATINRALETYQFSAYADAVYDLLWRDFCDWYLEGVKPTVKGNTAQQRVLRASLDAILRLLHPVCPFVTESIYEALATGPEVGAVEGLALGAIDHPSGLLCRAPWPEVDASLRDEALEAEFERLRSLITQIRDVRAQQGVAPRMRITLHAPKSLVARIGAAGGLVETMAGLEAVSNDEPEGLSTPFPFEGAELRLSGIAGEAGGEGEKQRLAKQIEELTQSLSVLDKRLANPGYTEKAPAHLVQQPRDQRDGRAKELETAKAALGRLG